MYLNKNFKIIFANVRDRMHDNNNNILTSQKSTRRKCKIAKIERENHYEFSKDKGGFDTLMQGILLK